MTDTKAPKRIWAAAYSHGGVRVNTVFHVGTNVDVYAFEQKEYIRADLYNELLRAADALARAVEDRMNDLGGYDNRFPLRKRLAAYKQAKENTDD